MDGEPTDSSNDARKVQKAGREKLRKDRLNEQFMELGKALDPDRPKNDKASIIIDAIQMLKDLTGQVGKLKSECASLTEESRELTQEKNDLREEKASLKADIENLNAQYAQRVRSMHPWPGMDHSMLMHPTSYGFTVPVPIPTAPIPLHPSVQPYPFFVNQNSPVVARPGSTFVPYMAHNPSMVEQQSTQHASQSQVIQHDSRSISSSRHDPRGKSLDMESRIERSDESNDVTTDLELKTPGSTSEQTSSPVARTPEKLVRKATRLTGASTSSGCSSSRSSRSISSGSNADGGHTS